MISITAFQPVKLGAESRHIGRDSQWQKMAESDKPIEISRNHLGGCRTVEWIIEVDKGSRGKPTGDMVQIEANGGDMYCNLSEPFLLVLIMFSFLCNVWPRRSNPRPKKQFSHETYMILVDYLWKELSNLGEVSPIFSEKVFQLADGDCFCSGNYVLWKAHKI